MTESEAWVYIMTNKPNGALYVGSTGDLPNRINAHRQGRGSAFTTKYNCNKLVYCEPWTNLAEARTRERAMKAWKRAWKIELIETVNPGWHDIAVQAQG